jgi:hypothetical protein
MLGRRSLSLPLKLCDLELECTLRQSRKERKPSVSKERSIEIMAGEQERPVLLRDHYLPSIYNSPSCLQLPNVTVDNYEIKSSIIQMLPSFYGLNNEDPYKHIDEFLEICSTIKMHGFTEDTLRMRLFPFSLKDKTNIVTSWTQMQQEFLKKYFLIGKTNQIRKSIISFAQFEGEQFHKTWERLKDFLRKCPHHVVPKWQLVQCFYDGLSEPHRQMVDASCGGTFMMKSENEAWILFDNLSENSVQHASTSRRTPTPKASKTENIFEASTPFDVTTKVDALSRKINQLMAAGFAPTSSSHISPQQEPCSFCSSTMHHVRDCPAVGQFSELSTKQANVAFARPGNDPYSNTYNPVWRNHPNFSWRAQASDNPVPQYSNQAFRPPSNIYRPPHQQAQSVP